MATVNLRGFLHNMSRNGPVAPDRCVTDLETLGIATTAAEIEGELAGLGYHDNGDGTWRTSSAELEERVAFLERLAGDAVQAAVNMKGDAKEGASVRHLQAVDEVRRKHRAYHEGTRGDD